MANRFNDGDFSVRLHPDNLEIPLHWRKPRSIFPCSMSDLFHKDVPFKFIDRIFAVMALCPQHTFQVLTKRPKLMAEYFTGRTAPPNVWLGVTAENQKAADERIPLLLKCLAAVRFVSIEPMLGPVNLECVKDFNYPNHFTKYERIYSLSGERSILGHKCTEEKLDWVIVGGESGSGARPMHPDWARSIRDQCQATNVPFFFKQWGEWLHEHQLGMKIVAEGSKLTAFGFKGIIKHVPNGAEGHQWPDRLWSIRVTRKAAGRLLDGREDNGRPGTTKGS